MPDSALQFLKRCGQDGRIVSSGDLTTMQIAEFQSQNRFFVDENGMGYALVPWDLTTMKDRKREQAFFDGKSNG
jgi:hypothetical protein